MTMMSVAEITEHADELAESAEQLRAAVLLLTLSGYSRHAAGQAEPSTYCTWTAVLSACRNDQDRAGRIMAKLAGMLLLLGMAPRTTVITPQGEAGELVTVWEALADPTQTQVVLVMNHTASILEQYAAGMRKALARHAGER